MIYEITKDKTYDLVITPDQLLPTMEELKQKDARFLTISVKDVSDSEIELIYHFEVEMHVENVHMVVSKDKPIQSITSVYLVAFIGENEAQDLFDITFDGLAVDLGGKMLKVETSPSTLLKSYVGSEPPIMRKLGKCMRN